MHQLMMPVEVDPDGASAEYCNLWLIDEGLLFHHGLAFDGALADIPATGSRSTTGPDRIDPGGPMLAAEESGPSMNSIVVVQLNGPTRVEAGPDQEPDPIEQALGYVERIRKGEVKSTAGRPLPPSEETPGFCYILCELTPTVVDRCRSREAASTADGRGYFFYHRTTHTYVEVSSVDRVLENATRRNRTFLDRLGIPAAERPAQV